MTRTIILPPFGALCCVLAVGALGNDIPATTDISARTSTDDGPHGTKALHDTYHHFASVGVSDPELSSEEVNKLILRGIVSDSPRIVELTIRAMAVHAVNLAVNEDHLSLPVRHFGAVPGLKEFLIGYWNDKVSKEGGVSERPQRVGESPLRNDSNPWVETVDSSADWLIVPRVLAAAFPGDEDVHELIWEMHQYMPDSAWVTLSLLNSGGFQTPEADKLRVDSLSAEDGFTLREAADGIAISKPTEGLEALASTVRGDPAKADFLIEAIVSYGPEAIPLIKEIMRLEGLPPTTQVKVIFGLESLEAVVRATP